MSERLTSEGYRFHSNDDEQSPAVLIVPATEAAAGHAAWLVDRFGEVPLTVQSWLRIVGDVWLVGAHPDWPESAAADDPELAGLFVLPMSPDALHKDNVSGDAPYGIALADGCVDGLWIGETTTPFVAYSRTSSRTAGSPGTARRPPRAGRCADGLLPL